nr:DUF4235 domain-containing protein [Schaalia sp. lx-260]
MSAGAMALTAIAAGKVAEIGWRAVTGLDVPSDDDENASLATVVAFAAASAAVVAIAQYYTSQGTRKLYASRVTDTTDSLIL